MLANKIEYAVFSCFEYGIFKILLIIMNILLFGLVIYNSKKYKNKNLIMMTSFLIIIPLEIFFIVFWDDFIDYIIRIGRGDTYFIISKIVLIICMTFISVLSCLIFLFAKFWKKEHKRYAVLHFRRDKKTGRLIKIKCIDSKPLNSSKEIFSLWNKVLITEGEHDLTLLEFTRSVKSFKDIIIFEGKIKQNWLTEEYLIKINSSSTKYFEVIKVKCEK